MGSYVLNRYTPKATFDNALEAIKKAQALADELSQEGSIVRMVITAQDPSCLRQLRTQLEHIKVISRELDQEFSQASWLKKYVPGFYTEWNDLHQAAQYLLLMAQALHGDLLKTSTELVPKEVMGRITDRLKSDGAGEEEVIVIEELRRPRIPTTYLSEVHAGSATSATGSPPRGGQTILKSPSLSTIGSIFSETNGIPLTNTAPDMYTLPNVHV